MARPPATDEQIAATRTALLDVAEKLYEEGGLQGMSFRAIAKVYGCSYSMPYSYFDSKADLVDRLRIRCYEWLRSVLEEAVAQAPDPIAGLDAVAETYVRAGISRPRYYELMYSDAGAMPEDDPEFVEVKFAALNVARDVIVAAADAAGAELVTDPDMAAHLFWVAAHGLVSLQHGGFLVKGVTGNDIQPELFRAMTQGLIRQPEPASMAR